jgi:hypothetical protein
MSFTDDELEQHCQYILGERRIKNKIVILVASSKKTERTFGTTPVSPSGSSSKPLAIRSTN